MVLCNIWMTTTPSCSDWLMFCLFCLTQPPARCQNWKKFRELLKKGQTLLPDMIRSVHCPPPPTPPTHPHLLHLLLLLVNALIVCEFWMPHPLTSFSFSCWWVCASCLPTLCTDCGLNFSCRNSSPWLLSVITNQLLYAVDPFQNIACCIYGLDRLQPMLWAILSHFSCMLANTWSFWDQVQTVLLSHTAEIAHVSLP